MKDLGSASIHSKTIPLASRQAVRERSQGRCERCGGPGSQWHHRRSRSVVELHRHDPCNGLWLCHHCHMWAHQHPKMATLEGLIVPRHIVSPGSCGVRYYQGTWVYLDCEGGLSTMEREE